MTLLAKMSLKFMILKKNKYLITLLICFSFGVFNKVLSQNIDKIVGIVGDKIVLKSDVEIQVRQLTAQGSPEEGLPCNLFEELMLQKLLLSQAEVDSVLVTEDEIEGELGQRINYFVGLFGGDQDQLEAYYNKSILQIKDEFREQIQEQLLSRRMQQQVVNSVKVTPAEVKHFFETLPADSLPFYDAEVEMSQIVIMAEVSEEQKKIATDELKKLKQRIIDGEDFATLAVVYSDDSGSATNGGDLGYMSRGELVNEFAAAAFNLENGEVSDIVETEFGLHLIQMVERRGEKANLRHILLRPEITSFDLEKAKAKLNDVRNKILTDSITFNQAVDKYSTDEQTKNNAGNIVNPQTGSATFLLEELDGFLKPVVDTLQLNQVSKPFTFKKERDGSIGYRIIKINRLSKAHQANLNDDYERIKAAAESKKQQAALEDWIAKKAPDTYIFVDDNFIDCAQSKKWISN